MPESWIRAKGKLQHRILGNDFNDVTDYPSHFANSIASIPGRMRGLGMTPAVPAFAGHVPKEMEQIYPNASFST